MKYKVAIVDDHQLVAKAFSGLIQKFEHFEVMYEAENGKEMIHYFKLKMIPDIVLLDVNMPEMNGVETALWLKNNYPNVKVLALSMNDSEESIVGMLKNGARGYLVKGCTPNELKKALDTIAEKGFYYSEFVTDHLIKSLNPEKKEDKIESFGLNERELTFIQYACSDLSYHEIADKMCVSPRTIDGYRESVFMKLQLKSRVSLVLFAIKHKLVTI
jgi:two-component system invasion response regulator UvrY